MMKHHREGEPRWLNADEQLVWRSLLSLLVLLLDRIENDLQREAGMSHAAYAVLANLSEAPRHALRLSELAAILWSSRTRVTYVIDQLEKRGWVRRESAPDDRRGTLAVLRDEGFTALRRAAPLHVESVRRAVFDHLEPQQISQLLDICQTLLPHLAQRGGSQIIDAVIDSNRATSLAGVSEKTGSGRHNHRRR